MPHYPDLDEACGHVADGPFPHFQTCRPSRTWSRALLSHARDRLLARDGRRIPLTRERLRFRGIDTHGQIERAVRRRKPVAFLVLVGAFVLEIEIERSVGIVL